MSEHADTPPHLAPNDAFDQVDLMELAERRTGGELNAAVTSALVGIQSAYLGRGPSTASTFHYNNVLVTLMTDVLTKAERDLALANEGDAVINVRQLFQKAMQADFKAAVERLTGREVTAIMTGNHLDPDIAAAIFVLDAPI
jgi:uncharacterized protein YbcI